MPYKNADSLVSCEWLQDHLKDENLRILDASFHLPQANRNAAQDWAARHIPGSVYIDINEVADRSPPLPHMLPDEHDFGAAMGALGISNLHKVIVYDSNGGHMAACRMWWMLRCFGHRNCAVLNGGLVRWDAQNRPTDAKVPTHAPESCTPHIHPELIKTKAQMLANIKNQNFQVLDARSPGRFHGVDPEPRPTKHVGHIPGSINVPFASLMQADQDFTFKPADELKAVFTAAKVDLNQPTVHSCGSGVTACVSAFALHLLGYNDFAIYDGSWAEWGNDDNVPIEGPGS